MLRLALRARTQPLAAFSKALAAPARARPLVNSAPKPTALRAVPKPIPPPLGARLVHPGLPLLLKGTVWLRKAKGWATLGTALGQIVRRKVEAWNPKDAPKILRRLDLAQRWTRRAFLGGAAAIVGGGGYAYYDSQETIPTTQRTRLMLTTREEEVDIGDYESNNMKQMMLSNPREHGELLFIADVPGGTSSSHPVEQQKRVLKQMRGHSRQGRALAFEAERLLAVATRIVAAAKSSKDVPPGSADLPWRVHLVHSAMKNAFVLPNGHIFVFTGILEDVPSDDVYAFLLGHECAHAVLRHGGENLSTQPFLETCGTLVAVAMSMVLPDWSGLATYFAMKSTLGVTSAAVDLYLEKPYSRQHEHEADEVGLLLSSRACFDPHHAQYLFHEFSREREKGAMPQEGAEALSTHPTDKSREDHMRHEIERAMAERVKCGCAPIDPKRRKKFDKKLQMARHLSCTGRRTSQRDGGHHHHDGCKHGDKSAKPQKGQQTLGIASY